MYDESFFFSLFFFLLSYKLLFYSERAISFASFMVTVCCSMALTQMIFPETKEKVVHSFTTMNLENSINFDKTNLLLNLRHIVSRFASYFVL